MTVTGWRSAHDLGLAAWFGGALMGAVGVNRAGEGEEAASTERVAAHGWAVWTPVNAAAITAHLAGGAALLADNAHRVATQKGVMASTIAKGAVTAAALAATAYSAVLGSKVQLAVSEKLGNQEKAEKHPIDLDSARRQLRIAQWAVPALTGALVILNALHGEQQRPAKQAGGIVERARRMTGLGS
ncbi:hypothetical protein [Streptomyces sp. NBC_01497]|uniref:hypothetical protein n=1 Tax=Streptomyces sp. NBC_01497 TaxID=2903885 RepID=UPI002E36F113|nr:hypothetical protein [Streptomyces sp. NBC_01497]